VSSETDDTVRLNGPRLGERSRFARLWLYTAGAAAVACLAAGGAWWNLRPAPAPQQIAAPAAPSVQPVFAPAAVPSAPVQQAPPAPAPAPPYAPPLASEAAILADAPEQLAIYRFGPQPAVVVLQFPSLADQAGMLNRVAALLEKEGYPRDRVLAHDELDAKIRASGIAPETFYYGHDYRAEDIAHFFTIASELNPEERQLQDLVGKLGWRERGAIGALVSVVRQTPASDIDAASRATILRHELSHGVYFTDPAYAQYCVRFWNEVLTAQERALFTSYLQREGYDPALTDLIINETQAYLIHTRDPRFFRPVDVGLTQSRAEELRRLFIAGMPPGWLRDAAATPAPAQPIPVRVP